MFIKWLAKRKQRQEEFESQRSEALASLLKRAHRVKMLEKDVERLEKVAREAQTDRNRLATKIMKIEHQLKKLSKNRATKKRENNA